MRTEPYMRIALDLQACQTASRDRGIGRYTSNFTRALLEEAGEGHEVFLGLDATYPEERTAVLHDFGDQASPAAFFQYFYPGPNRPHGHAEDILRPAARTLVRHQYRRLAADVVQVNSLFEGFVEHAACLGGLAGMPGTQCSVTLYDLIPLLYREDYLKDPAYRAWYEAKLRQLRHFDTFLSISGATRRDAIEQLGLDPERIHVVGGGVDPRFRPRQWPAAEREQLLRRLGITGRFVLYTGNGDPRKNLEGAIRAFAAVPQELRSGLQLVLNQVDHESQLRALARQLRLSRSDLVVTGRISDHDLLALLQNCELFFFPSLYEGFGLPVLEAMACGAPVIAGDNSSLPEVIVRKDALFDAASAESSASALTRVLADDDLRRQLGDDAVERARPHTWRNVARRALDAWRIERQRRERALAIPPPRRNPFKVAIVTPLPPERTGIAAYVADFGPALGMECDVDYFTSADPSVATSPSLGGGLHPWQELVARAGDYDHVVYQFGNSPFHSHMVDLLDQVPGTVVLHDLFLSSMFWHMDRHEGRPGIFGAELDRSHGRQALRLLAGPDGEQEARRRYPASRRVLERATSVLVHSREAMTLARSHFPHLKHKRITHMPMPVSIRQADQERRNDARRALGVDDHDLLVVSFGFIADTKLSHLLVEAAAALGQGMAGIRIILVGGNDGGAYGTRLGEAIADLPDPRCVTISGYVDDAQFAMYLDAADCAVQLRAMSRGESSKTVLDCMATGVPTIVNDYGPFAELPDDVVVKLQAQPTADDLVTAILELRKDPVARAEVGERGRRYVADVHAPRIIARRFVAALSEGVALDPRSSNDELVHALADSFAKLPTSAIEIDATHWSLQEALKPLREPRLFVDLSEVVRVDHGTGIHRVVRNIARELMLAERPTEMRVVPVAHAADNRMQVVEEFTHEVLGVPASGLGIGSDFAIGDTLLLLDSAWESCERFSPTIERIRGAGGQVGAVLYDLIPIRFPQYCVDFMPAVFKRWLSYVVENCDFIVCISKAVADDLHEWVASSGSHRPGLRIGHVHLGADIEDWKLEGALVSGEMRQAMDGGRSVLMVGTVEPRKRYDLALDAFEQAWAAGSELRLVIAGKQGWNVDGLARRIRANPMHGKKLFWLDVVTDVDLVHAYRNAERLLQTSDTEGFGLPIVEAAHFGRALLLSDIAVFREIAGDQAQYFTAGDASALTSCLMEKPFLREPRRPLGISWSESARRLAELIEKGGWDHEE